MSARYLPGTCGFCGGRLLIWPVMPDGRIVARLACARCWWVDSEAAREHWRRNHRHGRPWPGVRSARAAEAVAPMRGRRREPARMGGGGGYRGTGAVQNGRLRRSSRFLCRLSTWDRGRATVPASAVAARSGGHLVKCANARASQGSAAVLRPGAGGRRRRSVGGDAGFLAAFAYGRGIRRDGITARHHQQRPVRRRRGRGRGRGAARPPSIGGPNGPWSIIAGGGPVRRPEVGSATALEVVQGARQAGKLTDGVAAGAAGVQHCRRQSAAALATSR